MSDPGAAVFDPGLQPERTALSWRRTLLALVVVAVVGERLLSPALGGGALLLGAGGLVAVMALAVASVRRSRAIDVSLRARGDLSGAGGAGLFAAVTALSAAAGVLALVLLGLGFFRT